MKLLETIILLLAMIVIACVINKKFPNISLPLIQIIIGMVLWAVLGTNLQPDSEFFMLLFVAPILYMDGEHISNRELWRFKTPIILMVIGLVFSTIIVVGTFIHWMIPGIPYAAGFALAAVLSPTDAVAVKAVSNRIHLPHDVIMIVEGESLLNDASGLVAFNFAIAAMLTGIFSITDAVFTFCYIAAGGILFGAVMATLINYITHKLKTMGVEDATVFTLIQILTPFVIYYFAEELGCSGVLAVVAAGIVHSMHPKKKVSAKDANIKFVSDGTWATLLFSLNGLIFIILGIELPAALRNTIDSHQISGLTLAGYILSISVVLILIRFIWTFIFVGKRYGNRLNNSVLTALSGARGAVTMAACFSIPLLLKDGSPFPQRDLLLFISSRVVIAMLLVSNFILPTIAPKPVQDSVESIRNANRDVIQAAIDQLKREVKDSNKLIVYGLISHYEGLLVERKVKEKSIRPNYTEAEILLLGLDAEKKELERLRLEDGYDEETLRHINSALDFSKMQLSKRTLIHFFRYGLHTFVGYDRSVDIDKAARVKVITIEAAIKAIVQNITPDNEGISKKAISHYTSILEGYSHTLLGEHGKEYMEIKKRLELNAIHAQKDTVQKMLDMGEISHATAGVLRKYIRFAELAVFSEEVE